MVFDPTSTNFQLAMRLLNGVAGFFFSPSTAHVLVLRELYGESSDRSRHRFHSFLHVDSFMFAGRLTESPSHRGSGEKSRQKIFLRNEHGTQLSAMPDKKAVRREKWIFFLLFSFRKLSNEISSEKGDENTRTRCVKFHDVEKNLGLAELAWFVRAGKRVWEKNVDPRKRCELAANENLYMANGRKVDRRWLICRCCWWK